MGSSDHRLNAAEKRGMFALGSEAIVDDAHASSGGDVGDQVAVSVHVLALERGDAGRVFGRDQVERVGAVFDSV